MVQNHDIKTKSAYMVGAATATSYRADIGGAVATGMKRYVTFIRVAPAQTTGADGTKLFLCSAASAAAIVTLTAASAVQKMVIAIGSGTAVYESQSIPSSPDTEHPLFTIASGKCLTAYLGTAAGQSGAINLFVQYFDE